MKIKEMESRTGIDRATIRYYEKEGLLHPSRTDNGYREYSEKDLEHLIKIRLLRSLHISLIDIHSLIHGKSNLRDILSDQIKILDKNEEDILLARNLCKEIYRDEINYTRLNAIKYLQIIDHNLDESNAGYFQISDELPMVFDPIRRLFARSFDFSLYIFIWMIFQTFILNRDILSRSGSEYIVDLLTATIIMILVEPVLLHLTKTTAGKFIFGLRLEDKDGEHLSYKDAFDRTLAVSVRGLGLNLPFISIITHIISYDRLRKGELLFWDENITYRMKDRKLYRFIPYAAGYLLFYALLILSLYSTFTPPHTGDLTVKEFSQNYMHFADIYDVDLGNNKLLESGIWGRNDYDILNDYIPSHLLPPPFRYSLKDSIVKGVSFVVEIEDTNLWVVSYEDHMMLASLALAELTGFSLEAPKRTERFIRSFYQKSFDDFTLSDLGLILENKVEMRNLLDYTEYLFRNDENETFYFRQEFSVQKTSDLPSEEN